MPRHRPPRRPGAPEPGVPRSRARWRETTACYRERGAPNGDPDLRRHAAFWEAELAGRPYFCGADFTAADILMSFPLEAFAARGTGAGPRVTDWLARIHARPAYQRALRRSGPYAYA